MSRPVVVGITGGSGACYGVRLVEVILELGVEVHLTISPAGAQVIRQELGIDLVLDDFLPSALWPNLDDFAGLSYFHFTNYLTPMASGSFLTTGMVICPCSGGTLSAVAHGASRNLVQRAAEVHLKERRRLVMVPRETPLSLTAIENMRLATLAGAIILPAMPGWYHGVSSLDDLVDFVVARILDQLGLENSLVKRWGEDRLGEDNGQAD